MKINKMIDHTVLKADASFEEVSKLCKEAIEYDFASVCINPTWIEQACELLKGSDVKVCTVIGFPLGANTIQTKAFETKDAVSRGASEIDMVLNIARLKNAEYDYIVQEISEVVKNAGGNTVKVIIETCLLNEEQKIMACQAVEASGACFIKTSTGFSTGGATVEDVKLFKDNLKLDTKIKASGGVRSISDLENMKLAGATRIGTSGGVSIISGMQNTTDY